MAEGSRGIRLDRTLGPTVALWIEANLCHGPGDVQGNRVQLDDDQVRFLVRAYELDDTGRRVVRRAVYSRPKGRAKTEFAAMIAAAEALGPVRFSGWGQDGRPLGQPVRSPFVRLAATEEGQAGNTYEALRVMLTEGPIASAGLDLDVGLTRAFIPGGGTILPVSAAAASKDGGKETFAVFDETHLYLSGELLRMAETIRRNLAKRKAAEPWALETSTMYALGEESLAETGHRYAAAIAEGRATDPGFLFDHRQAPDGFDFNDPDELRQALAHVYGEAALWMDLDRLVAEAYDGQTREDDFRRYFLNQPTARSTAWISPLAWGACTAAGASPIGEETRVVLGFDGSYRLDASALVAATVEEHPRLFVLGIWERPERAGEEWVVPRAEVDATVRAAMTRYNVAELAYDPPGWHREADAWADTYGDAVVAFPTSSRQRMAAACSRFFSAVAGKLLVHDGDPRLARHIANCVLKETADGGYVTKDGRNSPRKIDAAVAAVIAHERACWHRENKPAEVHVLMAFV